VEIESTKTTDSPDNHICLCTYNIEMQQK